MTKFSDPLYRACTILAAAIFGLGLLVLLLTILTDGPRKPNKIDTAADTAGLNTTVDTLIASWIDEEAGMRQSETRAGIAARAELPDARPGYYPARVIRLARTVDSLYGVPAAVTLAQWTLESGWGRQNLNASNYFGHSFAAVRSYMVRPRSVRVRELVRTGDELRPGRWTAYADYIDIDDCFKTHGKYLRGNARYAAAFAAETAAGFARALGRAGYAQDKQYAIKLITIMKRFRLA